jgi:hypothetical protein
MYLVFGVWCAAAPHWTAEAVGFSLPSNKGFAEYVAVYGGLEFGVGIFFLLAGLKSELKRAGIIFGACFYLGIFVFRTIAILQVGLDIGSGINFYVAEGFLALWSVWLLKR